MVVHGMNGLLFCSFIWSLGILSIFPVLHPAWIGVVGFWHPCLTKWYINAACPLVTTQCDSEQTEHLEAFPLGVLGLRRYFFRTSSSGVASVPSRYYCVNVILLMLWLANELISLTISQEQWILECSNLPFITGRRVASTWPWSCWKPDRVGVFGDFQHFTYSIHCEVTLNKYILYELAS